MSTPPANLNPTPNVFHRDAQLGLSNCPVCRSEHLEHGTVVFDGVDAIMQDVVCLNPECDTTWFAFFSYIGFAISAPVKAQED